MGRFFLYHIFLSGERFQRLEDEGFHDLIAGSREHSHVLPHAYEHLTAGLTVDATPYNAVLGKELRTFLPPTLCNAVAQEHDFDLGIGAAQTVALLCVAIELRPITGIFRLQRTGSAGWSLWL